MTADLLIRVAFAWLTVALLVAVLVGRAIDLPDPDEIDDEVPR